MSQALRRLTGLKSPLSGWGSDERITGLTSIGLIESFGRLKHLQELYLDIPVNVNKEMLGALGTSVKPLGV